MMRGLFAASLAVTAALSLNTASPGRTSLDHGSSGAVAATPAGPASASSMAARVSQERLSHDDVMPAHESGASDASVERPKLIMVPTNPKLERRIGSLLPVGMSVRQAAAGFADQSQFVSAVHVSRNLGIPFDQLKAKVVGQQLSLGQAIQSLRPEADVWMELMRVRDLTSRDLY